MNFWTCHKSNWESDWCVPGYSSWSGLSWKLYLQTLTWWWWFVLSQSRTWRFAYCRKWCSCSPRSRARYFMAPFFKVLLRDHLGDFLHWKQNILYHLNYKMLIFSYWPPDGHLLPPVSPEWKSKTKILFREIFWNRCSRLFRNFFAPKSTFTGKLFFWWDLVISSQ